MVVGSGDDGGAGGIRTQVRVSVVPLTCACCRLPVPAGQRHLRHVDTRAMPVVQFVECADCARRGGRGGPLDVRPGASSTRPS